MHIVASLRIKLIGHCTVITEAGGIMSDMY